jgi:uncharacterized protein (TIGR03437 family)
MCAAFAPAAFGQNTSANAIATAGYLYPAPVTVAPGQVITVFMPGNIQGDITATVHQISDYPAPILEVRPEPDCIIAPAAPCSSVTAITIQIPYEMQPSCFVCAIPNYFNTQLLITVNGVAGTPFALTPLADRVHILTTCDTVVPSGGGTAPYNGLPCAPLVTHADGSPVTPASPAQGLEVLVAYAVGLGSTTPPVPTGKPATAATPANQTFFLDFNFRPNALATQPVHLNGIPAVTPSSLYIPLYSGLAPGYTGLYQINFVVRQPPAGTQACTGTVQSNLTVSFGGENSFDGAGICVAPPE